MQAKVYWFRSRLSMWLRFHRMNKKRLQDSRINEATICLDDYEEDNVDTSPCGMQCGKEKGHDGEGGSNVDATARERKKCGEKEKDHAGERDDKKKLDSAGFRLPRESRERLQKVHGAKGKSENLY